jgi:hypothetical protein
MTLDIQTRGPLLQLGQRHILELRALTWSASCLRDMPKSCSIAAARMPSADITLRQTDIPFSGRC